MTYKLYVKTHNITGMKYLGFTAKQDAHKYTGSGFHWKKHLKVHGKNYSTEIILETNDLAEIRNKGSYYSQLWDVVKSSQWANEKPETGPGVIPTPEMVLKQLETKRKNGTLNANTPESILKAKQTRKKNGTLLSNPEVWKKSFETKQKNGTLNTNTPETIIKSKNTKQARGIIDGKNPEVGCIYCHKIISLGNYKRWHGNNCKLCV